MAAPADRMIAYRGQPLLRTAAVWLLLKRCLGDKKARKLNSHLALVPLRGTLTVCTASQNHSPSGEGPERGGCSSKEMRVTWWP